MISLGSCEEKDKPSSSANLIPTNVGQYTTNRAFKSCIQSHAAKLLLHEAKFLPAPCPLDGAFIARSVNILLHTFAPRSSPIAVALPTTNRRRRSCDERSMLLVAATASSLSKRKRCRRRQPSWLTTTIACLFREVDPSLASSGRPVEDGARTGTDRYCSSSAG